MRRATISGGSCARDLQALFEHRARRRQHEHAHDITGHFFGELLRTLPVDVEQNVPA